MIIGFCGKIGAGKDTAGAYLVEKHGFERISFAHKLKVSAAACFGIDPKFWEEWKNNPMMTVSIAHLENEDVEAIVSVREFLQKYGTEAHRDVFGYNFWVDQALNDVDPNKNYVITDVRFDNEAIAVHEHRGLVIQLTRNSNVKDTHASEAGIPESLIDGKVANNGSKEQLYVLLDTLIERSLLAD